MMLRRFSYIRLWSRRTLLSSLALISFCAPVIASDGFWVTREGRKVPLQRSDTELAVTFRTLSEVGACAKRLADSERGVVVDFSGAPRARIKLLRLTESSPAPRALVAEPEIVDVRPIYRYAGTSAVLISSGTINVRLRRGLSDAEQSQVWRDHEVIVVQPVSGLENVFIVEPAGADATDVERGAALAVDSRTVWAQPNFRSPARTRQVGPSDPFFNLQWHLNNVGQTGGTNDADIDAPEAWLLADGGDILIGMFDDACDVDHEDLRGNYLGEGHDPSATGGEADASDPRPKQIGDLHGTAVMGLAVARANSVGVRGVAFGSQFTASRGLGQLLTNAEMASVYTFALQQEVDVHINSWGLEFDALIPSILKDAIETAFLQGRDLDGADGPERPRGMVILFASGNGRSPFDPVAAQVTAGRELATLPTVIGIGATNHLDQAASFSNFGPEIDLLAPGGGDFSGITTVDVDDDAGFVELGFNVGGVDAVTGAPDIDPNGLYTETFAGTSASCPIAAGVVSLVLSTNPLLTATGVRLVLEHSADAVSPDEASYDSVTGRSLRYGYGRVNARSAVIAAQEALTNGGRTWPERVANVRAFSSTLSWLQNGDPLEFEIPDQDEEGTTTILPPTTDEFLVLESDAPIGFIPQDGVCYDANQLGCGSSSIAPLPEGVSILTSGCALVCRDSGSGSCEIGAEQCVEFVQPSGTKHFAIYARSGIGRYSFGVRADSTGAVTNAGELPPGETVGIGGTGGTSGGGGEGQPVERPKVTVNPSPLSGPSPLTVHFTGNGERGTFAIDDSRTSWDFDISDGITPDATSRTADHTYVVEAGQTKVFTARLTMHDVATPANIGFEDVNITVMGSGAAVGGGGTGSGSFQIVVRQPGGAEEVSEGISPFEVELSLRSADAADVTFVEWDLGDGTTSASRQVSHTYRNELTCPVGQACDSKTGNCVAEFDCGFGAECTGNSACNKLNLAITAFVTVTTSLGDEIKTATTTITVRPGASFGEVPDFVLDGTTPVQGRTNSGVCGFLGLLPLSFMVISLLWMRFRR